MLIIEVRGDQVWRRDGSSQVSDPLPTYAGKLREDECLPATCIQLFVNWSTRYARAVEVGNTLELQALGIEIFRWLDQGGALAHWFSSSERALEIRTEPIHNSVLIDALLAMPWEILYAENMFLAEDLSRLFTVARCSVGVDKSITPHFSDLSLLFMAAAPEGQNELDYEAEEAAIIDVTRSKLRSAPLAHVHVEESGTLEFLGERLRLDGPFDALHISCHGDIHQPNESSDTSPQPVLLFETAVGGTHAVTPEEFLGALEGNMPPLVFVSACRTAERGTGRDLNGLFAGNQSKSQPADIEYPSNHDFLRESGNSATEHSPDLADPLVRRLSVQAPNVIGWDGSVYDVDASFFAESLYRHLSRGQDVVRAVALARRDLFNARNSNSPLGRHWHLARIYVGPGGGGILCDTSLPKRPALPDAEIAFLDKRNERVPVATRREFVGRRRQIQSVIRAFREGRKLVLIHGMGNLGKSSLAARVAARMPQHRVVVVFGECHALAIVNALKKAIEEIADGMPSLTEAQSLLEEFRTLAVLVEDDDQALEGALRRLLRGILNTHPLLLILDDLEQALVTPTAEQMQVRPKPEYTATLVAVFKAFSAAATASHCLLTSRYDFTIPDYAGRDLTNELVRIPLASMGNRERQKQWQAQIRNEEYTTTAASISPGLLSSAIIAAAGNPGLQAILTRPLLLGETATAESAIVAINTFRETATEPSVNGDLGDFFKRMAFETYQAAISSTQNAALSAATLFSDEIPIPRPALDAALLAFGINEPSQALDRLLALGLLDDWGTLRASNTATPNTSLQC